MEAKLLMPNIEKNAPLVALGAAAALSAVDTFPALSHSQIRNLEGAVLLVLQGAM